MANPPKGKFFWFYLLFLFASPPSVRIFINCSSDSIELPPSNETGEDSCVFDRQQIQIQKLEEIVKNLTELVSKLESRLSEPSKVDHNPVGSSFGAEEKEKNDKRKIGDKKWAKEDKDEGLDGKIKDGVRDGEKGRAVSVTKYSPFWSERFQFVSAVKLDSDATCINILPFRDYEGLSKYVAVGDERGRVYVFLRNGDVLAEFYTSSDSPITTMLSYMSVSKNESILVTGHKNGAILVHRVWEAWNGEEWSSLSMEHVRAFDSGAGEDGLEITILEVHHIGRMRYILSTNIAGEIRVFRENGTLHGSAKPKSRPLAFLKQRLLFLTENGAGSLDLKTMKVRESECEGLNHSIAKNYVFDATERSKAYGFTSDGDLFHVFLLGDIVNFKCRARSKRKFEMDGPLAFQAIKGYLLVVNEEKVFVYNVSSQHYVRVGGPRLVFSAGLDEIRSSFLNFQAMEVDGWRSVIPLIACDREKLVILGLGGGYVGMYRSNLPIFKGEFNTMLWTSPVLFFILFLFGAWQFFAKKKEALISWGPDDPFVSTSAVTGAPLGTSSGDRAFPDSSTRNSDIMDLRGGGLRVPARRYVSPPRYPGPGGAASSFRPGSSDHNSRPASVDPNFRTASELKFRGPTMEPPPGFQKRRESMFVNSPAVDDSN